MRYTLVCGSRKNREEVVINADNKGILIFMIKLFMPWKINRIR